MLLPPVGDAASSRVAKSLASYVGDAASGTVKSFWRYEGDVWVGEFTVPEGSVAAVTLPGEAVAKEYPAGTYVIRR